MKTINDKSFIRPGATVYYVDYGFCDDPLRKGTIVTIHGSKALMHEDGYTDSLVSLDMIFETERAAEAKITHDVLAANGLPENVA